MHSHYYQLPLWFGLSVVATVSLLALVFGRWEERAAGAALALDVAVTHLLRDSRWIGPQWGEFWPDIAFLALLIFVALRSRRFWPLFAAGFQLLSIATHLVMMLDPKVNGWTYATAVVVWTYFVMYAILFGVWGAWKEKRQLKAMALAGATSDPGATLR